MGKTIVYVCSPYNGDIERNKRYARELTSAVIGIHMVPITPHLYITECLDDNVSEERERGLEVAIELLKRSDLLYIGSKYGISQGMKAEIDIAKEFGIPIITKGMMLKPL